VLGEHLAEAQRLEARVALYGGNVGRRRVDVEE
jgi:hypothetical protein